MPNIFETLDPTLATLTGDTSTYSPTVDAMNYGTATTGMAEGLQIPSLFSNLPKQVSNTGIEYGTLNQFENQSILGGISQILMKPETQPEALAKMPEQDFLKAVNSYSDPKLYPLRQALYNQRKVGLEATKPVVEDIKQTEQKTETKPVLEQKGTDNKQADLSTTTNSIGDVLAGTGKAIGDVTNTILQNAPEALKNVADIYSQAMVYAGGVGGEYNPYKGIYEINKTQQAHQAELIKAITLQKMKEGPGGVNTVNQMRQLQMLNSGNQNRAREMARSTNVPQEFTVVEQDVDTGEVKTRTAIMNPDASVRIPTEKAVATATTEQAKIPFDVQKDLADYYKSPEYNSAVQVANNAKAIRALIKEDPEFYRTPGWWLGNDERAVKLKTLYLDASIKLIYADSGKQVNQLELNERAAKFLPTIFNDPKSIEDKLSYMESRAKGTIDRTEQAINRKKPVSSVYEDQNSALEGLFGKATAKDLKQTQQKDKYGFIVGKTYPGEGGTKAIYKGNNKWEEVK